jgi:hypothetical protein
MKDVCVHFTSRGYSEPTLVTTLRLIRPSRIWAAVLLQMDPYCLRSIRSKELCHRIPPS